MKKLIILNLIVFSLLYSKNEGDLSTWEDEHVSLTHNLKSDAKVIVPLEIITDLDIKATVIDNERLEIPFVLVMNKTPEKTYNLKYSEKIIDIDGDGRNDVFIESPLTIDEKIVKDNKLVVEGKNIGREGTHNKRVYISVEIKDGVIK